MPPTLKMSRYMCLTVNGKMPEVDQNRRQQRGKLDVVHGQVCGKTETAATCRVANDVTAIPEK